VIKIAVYFLNHHAITQLWTTGESLNEKESKMTQANGPIASLIIQIAEKTKEKIKLIEDFSKNKSQIDDELNDLKIKKQAVLDGLDTEKISRAQHILLIRGEFFNNSERTDCVHRAIKDLVSGSAAFKTQYFGVKQYSGFGDQGCDCEYFMGPRHGSIVFAVEMNKDARERDLSAEEVEDCLYYLSTLGEYQAAIKKAKGGA